MTKLDGDIALRSLSDQETYAGTAGRSDIHVLVTGGAHYQYELTLDPEIVLETRESIEVKS